MSSHQHIETYLNEFSFKINRSLWKENMFHASILKALVHKPLTKKMMSDVNTYV